MDERLEGTKVGRYRVGRLLGAGGMGAVYAGVQEPLGRPVAIKVLRSEIAQNADIVARFKREAELAASLSHPNIAQVTDFGVEDGRAFLVMDLLEGESLADTLARERRLSEGRVQRIAMQVLTALATAHERGVVHRDLKPENVFVQRVSGMELIKLLDFGIARVIESDHAMTHTGAVLGTPAYMSPEQARGKRVDARSDVFSIGAVLYEMLAGRRPFAAEGYHELMFSIVEDTPTPLAEIDPAITPALAQLVERAMQKTPEARFASAEAMRDALAAITGLREAGPTPIGLPATRASTPESSTRALAATMPSEPGAARAPSRRPIGIIALGAIAAAGLLGVGVWAGTSLGGAHVDARARPGPVDAAAAAAPMRPLDPAPVIAPPVEVVTPPAPPAPVEEAPPAERAAARAPSGWVTARCGTGGSEVEQPIVTRRDVVTATSISGIEGMPPGTTSVVRTAVNAQASAALTACYRGHPIHQGQDVDLSVGADGAVERAEPRAYCPIDPAIARCVVRALSAVRLDPPGSSYRVRVGLSIPR